MILAAGRPAPINSSAGELSAHGMKRHQKGREAVLLMDYR